MVVAKLNIASIIDSTYDNQPAKHIRLSAVYEDIPFEEGQQGQQGQQCEENKIFGKWTPVFDANTTIVNPAAYEQFKQGKTCKAYFVFEGEDIEFMENRKNIMCYMKDLESIAKTTPENLEFVVDDIRHKIELLKEAPNADEDDIIKKSIWEMEDRIEKLTLLHTQTKNESRRQFTELVNQIKHIRVSYNYFLYGWKEMAKSREAAMIYTAAENTRSWWGKLLGALGNPYPYKESLNPKSKIIEPMTDDTNKAMTITPENEVQVIKEQRVVVNEQIELVLSLIEEARCRDYKANYALILNGLFYSLHNYSIALGLRLGEIRKSESN